MKNSTYKLSLKFIAAFLLLGSGIFSQSNQFDGNYEEILGQWSKAKSVVRHKLGLSNIDFNKFQNFYRQKNDSLKVSFRRKVISGKITMSNVGSYVSFIESQDMFLYRQYLEIKKNYPSSIDEYSGDNNRKPFATCTAGCNNMDFSSGTLNGWNVYYEENESEDTLLGAPPTGYYFTAPVGGPAGAVTRAGLDPLVATSSSDYQVAIMTGGNDPLVPTIPKVYPFGGSKFSARVGDSTWYNSGVAILSQTFMVTAANANLTYAYAVFLENSPLHNNFTEAFFNVSILDSVGDTITGCFNYNVISNNAASKGFDSLRYFNPDNLDYDYVYYKNWQLVSTDLKKYIGHCVTLQFKEADCSPGGHFGYAYVTANCSVNGYAITSSSPTLCGQKYITLSAPPGGAQYLWSGPANGIIGSDTTSSIKVDSAGTYQVIINPVTGKSCADTLTITIKKGSGTIPVPDFTADTVCAGDTTQFINTSAPGAGAGTSFYWSFTNNGTVNDSATNPKWLFTQPGVYNVQLTEITNGCGADTTIQIKVDSIPIPKFRTSNNRCSGQAVTFTNQSTGATTYTWVFQGAGTSSAVNPTATFPAAGNYTVSLTASNGKCDSTIVDTIKINATPTITVTGNDTICPGVKDTLTASGAGNYNWNPGGRGNPIYVSPTTTSTYIVTGRVGGGCTGSDTVKVVVKPVPILTVTPLPSDTICSGGSTTLTVTGASNYTWAPGTGLNTTSGFSVIANPTVTTVYTVIAAASANGCSAKDSNTVTVFGPGALAPKVTITGDSSCSGSHVILTASGASTFLWSNGATTSSITIAPVTLGDTTVSVVAHSSCRTDTTINVTVFVEPTPVPFITGNDSICPGTSALLTVSDTAKGSGHPGYLWSGTTNRTDTITVAPNKQTTYTVTAADGGCSVTATFTVSIRPVPFVRPKATPDTVCLGSTTTLTATGSAGATYSWSPATTPATGDTVKATPTAVGTTIYTVTATDICSATRTITVHVISDSIATPKDSLSRDSICPGSSLTMYAEPYNSSYTYTWSAGQTTGTPNADTVAPSSPTNASVTYTVTIKNKCTTKSFPITVYVADKPVPTIKASANPICAGSSVVLTASSNPSNVGYLWLNGSPGNRTNTITVNPTTQTVYTVEAAIDNCGASATDTIDIKPGPTVNMNPTASTCSGDSVTIAANGGGTYQWFNGATTSSITIRPTANTDAWVIVSNGCSTRDSTVVTVNPGPAITMCSTDTTINLGGTATMCVTGGVAWQWEPSATVSHMNSETTTAMPSVTTVYTVVVTGANGCNSVGTDTVKIACHDLVIPNVFTPDLVVTSTTPNDNIFFIQGVNPGQQYHIEIYNRWGAEVFSSTNPDDSWTGKDKSGNLVATGVYYYIITTTCGDKNYDAHGYVQVIRNK